MIRKSPATGNVILDCDASACVSRIILAPTALWPDAWIKTNGKHPREFCSHRCQSNWRDENLRRDSLGKPGSWDAWKELDADELTRGHAREMRKDSSK